MPNFDEAAHAYHESAFVQKDLAEWLAEWLEPDLSGKTALEFGAGTGMFSQWLVKGGASLRATDVARAMVEEGKLNVPAARWERLDAWVPGILPKFDRIYSSSLLQWCQNPKQTFQRWRSALQPDGRILCGLLAKESLRELEAVLPGSTPFAWLSPQEWQEAFGSAGFTILRSEATSRVFTFPSARVLLRFLREVGATDRHQFGAGTLRTALRQYGARFPSLDGKGIRSTWNFFRIEAQDGGD